MYKKLKCILLMCVMFVTAAIVALGIEFGTKKVWATESEEIIAKPIVKSLLSTNQVNELWVGDIIWFAEPYEYPASTYIYKIDIVEGDSVSLYGRYDRGELAIECVKTGLATINVYFNKDGKEGITTYKINVTEGKEVVISTTEIRVKIGECPDSYIRCDNKRYGSWVCFEPIDNLTEDGSLCKYAYRLQAGGWGPLGAGKRSGGAMSTLLCTPTYPGEVTFKLHNEYSGGFCSNGTAKLIIEKPVIEHNISQIVTTGDTYDFQTKLGNIGDSYILKSIYDSEITIIKGAECIESSAKNYTDLATSEKLKFVKAGEVQLKITYKATPISGYSEILVYTAEEIITFNIVDKGAEIVQDVKKQEVDTITKDTLLNALNNSNSVKVNCTENNKTVYSWQFAPKDKNSLVNVNMKIETGVDDKEVTKLSGNVKPYVLSFGHHGKLPDNTKVSIMMPTDYDNQNVYVYHVESDGTAKLYFESKVENGYLNLALTHCSKYFVTKQKIETVVKETTTDKETEPESIEMTMEEEITEFETTLNEESVYETESNITNEVTSTSAPTVDTNITDTQESEKDKEPSSGSEGNIVFIVLGVILIVAVVVGGIYLYRKSKNKL